MLFFLIKLNHKLHFRIDLKAMVKNGKIIARLGDRKNVESEKSVMKLNGKYILLAHLLIK